MRTLLIAALTLMGCATAPGRRASVESDCAILKVIGAKNSGDGDATRALTIAEAIKLESLEPQPKCDFQRFDLATAIGYSSDQRYAAATISTGPSSWRCVAEREKADWKLVGCGGLSEVEILVRRQ